MKITDLLSSKTIELGVQASGKEDIIKKAVALIAKSGAIADVETYEKGVFKREEESTTGIGEGIAIPHCKSTAVKKPALAAMVIPNGVEYASLDGEKVNLLFLIAAPNTEDNVHLEVLARLSNLLMDENFKNKLIAAKTKKEFLEVIDAAEADKVAEESASAKDAGYPRVIAVTACPTGIAHTYMAEQALKDKAAEMGISIKVETNGSGGAKNVLTDEEIAHAEGVIIAADALVEMDRFNGKRLIKVAVAKGIHEPEKLINQALSADTPVFDSGVKAEKKNAAGGSFWHNIYNHLMSGVSHMLPFVIGGGILIALAFLVDTIAGSPQDSGFGTHNAFASFLKTTGGVAFNFMIPIFSGFIAFSIAGRPGLAVGVVAGALASTSTYSISYVITGNDTGSNAGFLGALVGGFVAGYIIKLLERAFKFLPKSMDGLKPTLIYPLLGIFAIGGFMFLINTPFTYINIGVSKALNWMGSNNLTLLLGVLLAGMMAIDMGGPINKAAYVFGTALLTTAASSTDPTYQAYCYQMMAAVMVGGMVPPLGIALAADLFPHKFTKQERRDSKVNYVMGLGFITEGAIPYAAADPGRVIPSCVAGSAVAGLISTAAGCTLMAPHGGIFVFAVVGKWYFYLLALACGMLVTAIMLGILRKKPADPELNRWKGVLFFKELFGKKK